MPGARLALGVDRQQFGGDVAHFFARPCAWRVAHCSPPSECSGASLRRGAGVAADQVQLRDRHVQLVALGVFDREEFAGRAADVERDQAPIAADAVIVVHDRRADRELAEVADDRFGIARRRACGGALAARVRRTARAR